MGSVTVGMETGIKRLASKYMNNTNYIREEGDHELSKYNTA
jgi:hypothetical protein